MNRQSLLVSLMLTGALVAPLARGSDPSGASANRLVIHADQAEDTISRNIYGQFSEHLGRCIYGGIWVGEDSANSQYPRYSQ